MHVSEVIEGLQAQIVSKENWLETFGWGPKKWPEHEVLRKERELRVLKEALKRIKAG